MNKRHPKHEGAGDIECDVSNADIARPDTSSLLHFKRGPKLPLVRQGEASECGLACLAMIAGYYGHHANLAQLRHQFSLSLKGVTLARLMEMAQTLGLSSRSLRLEMDEMRQLTTPCILHWDMDHYVVLRSISRKRITILDPAVGERSLSLAEASRHFTGVALELTKGPAFQRKKPPAAVSLRTLAGSIQGLGRSLVTIFGLAFALEVFSLLAPQFMQVVVDQVLADGDHDLLSVLGISFLLLLVLQVAISALRTWAVIWLNTHLSLNWIGNVFQHLMRLPQTYFLKRHLGDVVSRFGAIDVLQRTLTTQFVSVIIDGLMATMTLVVMLIYSPLLASLTVAAVATYAALRALYYRAYRESNLSQIVVSAKQQSVFMEAVRGAQTIRLYNQSAAQTSRYLNATADTLNTSIAVQRLNLLFGALNGLTGGIQRIAVLWIGAWLALKEEFTAGMLMAFVAYSDQFSNRAAGLVDYLIQLSLIRLQTERLADIVMTPIERHASGVYAGARPEPSIAFENVSFRYAEGEPWILKDCTFEVQAGQSIAIVGPSGCGKTTLIRLLLGLLDPVSGTIRVGDIELRHLGKDAYRRMIGSVMQDDVLFAGSIADNICLFDESSTMDRIERAAHTAQLHNEISKFPMGYQTLIGDMGSALSGGQQQRLHLARALYRDPQILVLDEATSHLDLACEAAINQMLVASKITRIVVAHRPQTIETADRILACADGKIIELNVVRGGNACADTDKNTANTAANEM